MASMMRGDVQVVPDAAEHRPITMGEAVNKLLLDPDDPIEDGQKTRTLRKRLVHEYDRSDDMMVWAILHNHLAPLREHAVIRTER